MATNIAMNSQLDDDVWTLDVEEVEQDVNKSMILPKRTTEENRRQLAIDDAIPKIIGLMTLIKDSEKANTAEKRQFALEKIQGFAEIEVREAVDRLRIVTTVGKMQSLRKCKLK